MEGRNTSTSSIYHYVQEQVGDGKIVFKYCPTEDMLADLLTKGIETKSLKECETRWECMNNCRVRRSVEHIYLERA